MALGLATLTALDASAQIAPKFGPDNFALNYVGARFSITSPASVAGVKNYTLSNDGSGTAAQWGRAVDSVWLNVPIVKAYDTLGLAALQNGVIYPSLVGKFALIFRGGGVTFTQKAYYSQLAGAIGCIIVNDVPGGPVGMANTATVGVVTIPVMMISDVDGAAINNILKNTSTPVTLSLSKWSFGFTNDIGLLANGMDLGPAYAIPFSQLSTNNGNPRALKGQTGGYIGNFGTANETNVKLFSSVTWTPTGGGATTLRQDSVTVATFNKIDSIIVPSVATAYDFHATGTGRFDMNYSVSMTNIDQLMGDNSASYPMYVTDSIYSKSRYDFVKGEPIASVGYQLGTPADYIWGPLYYVAKGGYAVRKAQFTVSAGAATPTLESLAPINILLFKWVDGANGSPVDSLMDGAELTLTGIGTKNFTVADSGFTMFTVNMTDDDNPNNASILQDNSFYWIAAEMPPNVFLGCDGVVNYFPRTFNRSRATSSDRTWDFYAPFYTGTSGTLIGSSSELIRPVPFEGFGQTDFPDSVRYAEQNKGLVPSIAMMMSTYVPQSVATTNPFAELALYPNPATDVLNVKMKLDKPSSKVYISVADAMGKVVSREQKANLQNEVVKVSTASLAAGQYYLIINADQGTTVRKFTVLAK